MLGSVLPSGKLIYTNVSRLPPWGVFYFFLMLIIIHAVVKNNTINCGK